MTEAQHAASVRATGLLTDAMDARRPHRPEGANMDSFMAEAIAEAVDRQNMRFVPIKTDDQLDLQAMHRVRDRLVARRTSVINQLRAFLLERGMVFAKTPFKLTNTLAASGREQPLRSSASR